MPTELTEGLHHGIPHDDYLADPVPDGSLSASGCKLLLPPSCPVLYRWRMDHPEPPRESFDLGTIAHTTVLGVGADVARIDASDWRTKAAKEEAQAARDAGLVPLLAKDADRISEMVSAVRTHPLASQLLDPEHGAPEVTAIWRDDDTGVTRRARYDWLRQAPGMRPVIVDYKTAQTANPDRFARTAADYGYHLQDSQYRAGIRALGIDDDPLFVFLVQMKDPPYLISPIVLDADAKALGDRQCARAMQLYADCRARDEWPGFTTDVATVDFPPYIYYQESDQ